MTAEGLLPASFDAERFVLGSILLDDTLFPVVADGLRPRISAWRSTAGSSSAWGNCTAGGSELTA